MSKASNAPSAQPTTTEEWRAIPGWPYEVSSAGRVRHVGGRVLSPKASNGYVRVWLCCAPRKQRRIKVAALVAAAFLGSRPDGYQINHRNGIKTDDRAENLEYATPAGNTQHAFGLGLLKPPPRKIGSSNGNAVLAVEQVREIIRRKRAGEPYMALAVEYGVSDSHIRRIVDGSRWADALKERADGLS